MEFDKNAVELKFYKYVFDVISIWIYCAVILGFIGVYAGRKGLFL